MEKNKYLPEDIIKCNFFRLSLSSQIKIYEMYLNDLKNFEDTRYYDFFKEMFKKYISIVRKFNSFKSDFSSYTNDDKNDLRYLINKCRNRINPNNSVVVDSYFNVYQDEVVELSDSCVVVNDVRQNLWKKLKQYDTINVEL